ncbi:RagB/SusD family nutrient uptake outer membrane protein [Parapedobacter koreensis]|uniref:Starch-binding associating with outer membrane n=1 Tax=Parapedobacter koreensis TaxID=332977 RepID=A0A1H7PTS4_9SPHI|nr:RagB/SusD family nutrient uptake outer membrane protein [Parapedobacter koreensis]SEL39173.1 Starch-binding associating with outer membrane [Parapedobacter koreensis]
MKKIFLLLIITSILTSCGTDFIDLAPPSNLNSSTFYKTQQDINQATLSAYASLRTLYNGSFYRLGEIRSDNTTYSWLAGNPANEKGVDEFASPLLPENSFLQDCWNDSYHTILRCNLVLGRSDAASFTSESEHLRTQYKAEASFIRALTYFWLNRVFGGQAQNGQLLGVIKVDREITPDESYELSRVPLEEIYDLIVADLQYAEANLPEAYSAGDRGRATKGSAAALLGKVYMTMAGYPLNKGNEYYNLAIGKFQQVIGSGSYSLLSGYDDVFDVNNKNNAESIFEIQYMKGAPGGDTGSPWNNNFAPRFSDKEVVLVGDKSGQNAPTQDMSDAYETGDPRKYVSMRDGWINAQTGAFERDKYVRKYYDVATSGSDNGNNWIELRLADIYLLYAEALVRTGGDKTTALSYVNDIRERARNTPGDPGIERPANLLADYQLTDFANDQQLLLAIERERRVELAFENHRWFDLVRTGRAEEVMVAEQRADGYNPFTWSDNALAYPIPMTVMQSNPQQIIQNNGYTQM